MAMDNEEGLTVAVRGDSAGESKGGKGKTTETKK